MLAKIQDFSELLISPDNGEKLKATFDENGTMITCSSSLRNFRIFKGLPILTPEETIVDDDKDLESLIPRPQSTPKKVISRLVYGANRVAARNVKKIQKQLKEVNPSGRPKVLIVGAGIVGDGSQDFYDDPDIDVISFDIYFTEFVNFIADGHKIPIADETVDAVWIQAVLEHVIEPSVVVSEMFRVLKTGGLVYAETPFMQHVHEGSYDFQRFTESGHRWLFKRFEIIDSGVVWGPGTTLQWSIRYFIWALTRSKLMGILFSMPFVFLRWLEVFMPENHRSDGASNLYFMGKKTGADINHNDIVSFYRGAQH